MIEAIIKVFESSDEENLIFERIPELSFKLKDLKNNWTRKIIEFSNTKTFCALIAKCVN